MKTTFFSFSLSYINQLLFFFSQINNKSANNIVLCQVLDNITIFISILSIVFVYVFNRHKVCQLSYCHSLLQILLYFLFESTTANLLIFNLVVVVVAVVVSYFTCLLIVFFITKVFPNKTVNYFKYL